MTRTSRMTWLYVIGFGLSLDAAGEVISDGSLGRGGAVRPGGGYTYHITPDYGRQIDANLFHSFSEFGIRGGEIANFSGPGSVERVISRVTGGNASDINGTLSSNIPGADVFLINPAGVIFGQDAKLDIQGSFHASTADYIRLEDNKIFNAVPGPQDALLTSAPVSAFGFIPTSSPAAIRVESGNFDYDAESSTGGLIMPNGQTFSLIAGNVTVDGGVLIAPEGRIQIISMGSSGEVRVPVSQGDMPAPGGAVTITGASLLQTSGGGGGSVVIRGEQFVFNESMINSETYGNNDGEGIDINVYDDLTFTGRGVISTSSEGAGKAGNITLHGKQLDATNLTLRSVTSNSGQSGVLTVSAEEIVLNAGVDISVDTKGSGDGGRIVIGASKIDITDTSIAAATAGSGRGGDIVVTANNELTIERSIINAETYGEGNSGSISVSTGTLTMINGLMLANSVFDEDSPTVLGNAGNIEVQAETIELTGGSSLSSITQGTGQGGRISVSATDSILIEGQGLINPFDNESEQIASGIFTDTKGSGKAGDINVNAPVVTLRGGVLGATATAGATDKSRGGNITLVASETLSLERDDKGRIGGISTETLGAARAGDIFISTGTLTMAGGEIIANSVFDEDSPTALGNAGDITVDATHVSLSDGARMSAITRGAGRGGTIRVTANDSLLIEGQGLYEENQVLSSGLFTSTEGVAQGGDIELTANNIILVDNAAVNAESTGSGNAGSININALSLLSHNSAISTDSEQSDGGNINIVDGYIIFLRDNSAITTSVGTGEGKGGNIDIDSRFVILDSSDILANAWGGPGGNIFVVADGFIKSPDSLVEAIGKASLIPGTIEIQAPDTDFLQSLAPLPAEFEDPASRLGDRCSEKLDVEKVQSTFKTTVRDGLPLGPEAYLLGADIPFELRDLYRSKLNWEKKDIDSELLSQVGLTLVPCH